MEVYRRSEIEASRASCKPDCKCKACQESHRQTEILKTRFLIELISIPSIPNREVV
jgi:hypothetical protein